jgi:glutaminyl-peptide cyclotransferase
MRRNNRIVFTIAAVFLLAVGAVWYFINQMDAPRHFDGQAAYQDVVKQMSFGPRVPGSPAHGLAIKYILDELQKAGWDAQIVEANVNGASAKNILAKRGSGPITLIGAHYDSRRYADQDPDINHRTDPVPGANDGASGVAVMLELARTLPRDLNKQVWFLFIDLEDQGDIQGQRWAEGADAFAASLTEKPEKVVILDMIGDSSLNIYYERNSSKEIAQSIFETAARLGYQDEFIQQYKYSMLDDHTPFLQRNIPAVDLIDFDYPYWHTTADTADKVSAKSLQIVGNTIWTWLQQ